MPPFAFHCRRVPTQDEVANCLTSHSKKSRCKSNCRGRETKIFLRGFELQRPRPPPRPPPCPPKVLSLLPRFFSHFHPAPSQEEFRHCLSSRLLEICSKMTRGGPRCPHLGNCNWGAHESKIGRGGGTGRDSKVRRQPRKFLFIDFSIRRRTFLSEVSFPTSKNLGPNALRRAENRRFHCLASFAKRTDIQPGGGCARRRQRARDARLSR